MGDWYNAIPWGDKEKACEKVGLNYPTAQQCGFTASKYEFLARVKNLSFAHHKTVAVLPHDQRAMLLMRAEAEGWTSTRLAKERDKLLGKEKILLPDFDAKVDKAVMAERHSADKKPDRE